MLNKFNARIMTDLSIYTDPKKNTTSDIIVPIRSELLTKYTLKEIGMKKK